MTKQTKFPIPEEMAATNAVLNALTTRRAWLGIAAVGIAGAVVGPIALRGGRTTATSGGDAASGITGDIATDVKVYKSPTCGCCEKWMEYMKKDGFALTFEDMENVVPVKQRLGVPQELWSCHTSVIGNYTFEGHVPADLIRKVLSEKAAVAGLAVAGMPPSAPGMDQGSTPYEVKSFTRDGKIALYATR